MRIDKIVKRAFTLVEIMIVILVTGIVTAVAIPNLIHSRQAFVSRGSTTNFRESQPSKQDSVRDKKQTLGTRLLKPHPEQTSSISKVRIRLIGPALAVR